MIPLDPAIADVCCCVFDMNKQERCTRSLSCKVHSLKDKRVIPRSRPFDDLLAEQQKGNRNEQERKKKGMSYSVSNDD